MTEWVVCTRPDCVATASVEVPAVDDGGMTLVCTLVDEHGWALVGGRWECPAHPHVCEADL